MIESLIFTGHPKCNCSGIGVFLSGEQWEGRHRGGIWAPPFAPVSLASALMVPKVDVAAQPLFPHLPPRAWAIPKHLLGLS